MRRLVQLFTSAEFLRFVLAGGTAAAANIGSRLVFSQFLPFSEAVALACVVGVATAYLLMRRFVFAPSGRQRRDEITRFVIVNLVAAVQVWVVSIALAERVLPAWGWRWQAETLAHVVGVASTVVTSYLLHKLFTFRRRLSG
jgi:putative flippase GtrA